MHFAINNSNEFLRLKGIVVSKANTANTLHNLDLNMKAEDVSENHDDEEDSIKTTEKILNIEPSKILFIEKISKKIKEDDLRLFFKKFTGLNDLRYMGKYAIIEFDSISNAKVAYEESTKSTINDCRILVSYGKN